jgi:hypothetical protein
MGVLPGFGGSIEVLAPAAAPPIASQSRVMAMNDLTRDLFPSPPIIIGIVSFYLVGGSCRTPQESAGKRKGCLSQMLLLIYF